MSRVRLIAFANNSTPIDWPAERPLSLGFERVGTDTARINDNLLVPPGTEGTTNGVDSAGTVFVAWDNGCYLGLLPGIDQWEAL